MKKVLLICNKCSGKAFVKRYIKRITKELNLKEYEIDQKNTEIDFGADRIIEAYDKPVDLILICGGDGTLSQTINGIVKNEKQVPILYIPFGTTNDFAKTLKLPKNKLKSIKNINKYKEKQIDVGEFENKYFYYIAVFGMLSDISYTTPQQDKNMYGRLAYYKQALKEARRRKVYKVKIKTPNRIIEDDIIYGSISNSTSIAGFRWFKDGDAELDDGEFEIILIRKINNFIDLVITFFSLVFKIKNEKHLYCFKSSNLNIICEEKIDWTLDGEYGGNLRQVQINNIEKAVKFLVP